ncbi:MAG TPA: DUF4445 domain-containing protein [Firmicutes bacterium]|nr:DUF4445 domain-containing protein [Bacillota bacterium]
MPRVTLTVRPSAGAHPLATKTSHGVAASGPTQRDVAAGEPAVTIQVDPGATILDAIHKAGIDFQTSCGGIGRCGKCKVRVDGDVSAPRPVEHDSLSPEEIASGLRLACQARVLGDVSVVIPQIEPAAGTKILTSTVMPALEGAGGWQEAPQRAGRPQVIQDAYGVAIDIGTTTLVVYLIDLSTGRQVAVSSAVNPQARFGDDVISRISYAAGGRDHVAHLREAVISGINLLIDKAAREAGVSIDRVYKATVVGNTCMHHLFLGIDPSPLGVAPYRPVIKDAITLTGSESGLHMNKTGRVFLLPNIGGFVGADTVAVILASGIDRMDRVAMAIDLGTNGEIVISAHGKLLACSTAAGPAFEGWRISSGMRAGVGAIDRVYFGEDAEVGPAGAGGDRCGHQPQGDTPFRDICFTVIGSAEPAGICGSGLADLMAGLLTRGIITGSGRMLSPREATELLGDSPLSRRIRSGTGGPEFVVAEPGVIFTQRDARELQLACAAIHTGLEILKEIAGVGDSDIESVYLAGGFGNYLAPESARILGLVPAVPLERIMPIGNGAGAGAMMALLSEAAAERAVSIGRSTEHIELASYPRFSEVFMNSMVYTVYLVPDG